MRETLAQRPPPAQPSACETGEFRGVDFRLENEGFDSVAFRPSLLRAAFSEDLRSGAVENFVGVDLRWLAHGEHNSPREGAGGNGPLLDLPHSYCDFCGR